MKYKVGQRFRPTDCESLNERLVYTVTQINEVNDKIHYDIALDGRYEGRNGTWGLSSFHNVTIPLTKLDLILQ